jgi:hypothetical protein
MCRRCDEIDTRIRQLQDLARRVLDGRTLDGIDQLIADLEAGKVALHPYQCP